MKLKEKMKLNWAEYLAQTLFWSWNGIFIAFILLGFVPVVLPDLWIAVQSGTIPFQFLFYGLVLTAVPLAVVIAAVAFFLRRPATLFALGYGVEGPLMVMLLVRFFVVQELNSGTAYLMVVALLGFITYLWHLADENIDARPLWLTYGRVMGLNILLALGIYTSLLLSFYILPFTTFFIRLIGDFFTHLGQMFYSLWDSFMQGDILLIPFAILWVILFVYTSTLFILMPVAVPVLYFRAWWQGLKNLVAQQGLAPAVLLSLLVLLLTFGGAVYTNQQPQQTAFLALQNPPTTLEAAKQLLENQEQLRAGLLNAYLARSRYISAQGEVEHIKQLYENEFGVSEATGRGIQTLYEQLMTPLLYQPLTPAVPNEYGYISWQESALTLEAQKSAELYAHFFDQPLIKAERQQLVRAAQMNWNPGAAESAWQAVDDREIYLLEQKVTIQEYGDWAQVELYEVYQNQTSMNQEVVYYFNLPESAVLTGLWLGNSAALDQRFTFHIAPRGAAQAVYQAQVQRQMDPALLEQIGPRQYRLRVFPVLPKQWAPSSSTSIFASGRLDPAPPLHMWLTYQTLADGQNWPLPNLAEKLNVYWDKNSVRLLNGRPLPVEGEEWLPASVPASQPIVPQTHQVTLSNGQTLVVRPVSGADQPHLPAGVRLAVVVDRSYSMTPYAAEVEEALQQLAKLQTNSSATVDVYLTASEYRGEEPSRLSIMEVSSLDLLYIGGQHPAVLLTQFADLRGSTNYDALLVLTDGTGYELGVTPVDLPTFDLPIWMVHLRGDLPYGYDDPTLEAIQASGGGAAGDVTEALTRLAAGLDGAAGDVLDGYEWRMVAGSEATTPTTEPSPQFSAFAGRWVILQEMARQRGQLTDVAVLDELHALAQQYGLVTPYSSMIVLVNEQQEEMLRQLSEGDDRFEREYEEMGETQNDLTVTGVPEPEEWLLIFCAVALLGWYLYQQRFNPGRVWG